MICNAIFQNVYRCICKLLDSLKVLSCPLPFLHIMTDDRTVCLSHVKQNFLEPDTSSKCKDEQRICDWIFNWTGLRLSGVLQVCRSRYCYSSLTQTIGDTCLEQRNDVNRTKQHSLHNIFKIWTELIWYDLPFVDVCSKVFILWWRTAVFLCANIPNLYKPNRLYPMQHGTVNFSWAIRTCNNFKISSYSNAKAWVTTKGFAPVQNIYRYLNLKTHTKAQVSTVHMW